VIKYRQTISKNIKDTVQEFPLRFWILVIATFIDRIGGTLIFPFFALYVTQRFGVGMTQAGVLLAIFSLSGFLGDMTGGALTDRFGRRAMVLFGLIFSALSSLSMGIVNQLSVLYFLALIVGLLSNIAGPARQAMVADLLPAEKQAEGYGILRVAGNLAWIIGPTLGGLLAARSYLLLFILDAITSLITALIVYRLLPETKPKLHGEQQQETLLETYGQSVYRILGFIGTYVGRLSANVQYVVRLPARCSRCLHPRLWVHVEPGRRNCCTVSILGYSQDQTLCPYVDDDSWDSFLLDWFYHVWFCVNLPALCGCHPDYHRWGNDRDAGGTGPGGPFCPRR
jgi:MFS family permease